MAYWRLFYHLVWATYERAPLIASNIEPIMHGCFHTKAKDLGIWIQEAGNVEDHVHIVVTIPPTLAVADVVGQIKGFSSHTINHSRLLDGTTFRWQDGYGALSLGERSLPAVTQYVRHQKAHHHNKTTKPELERMAQS